MIPVYKGDRSGVTASLAENRESPFSGEFHYSRASFEGAGIDNYTTPPGQNPEMFTQLLNVQPPLRSTLARRWGYSLFNSTASGSTAIRNMLTYQNDVTSTRRLLVDSNNGSPASWFALNEDGALYNGAIFSGLSGGYGLTSRSTLYVTNATNSVKDTTSSYQKWDGSASGGTSNWGIRPLTTTGTNTLVSTGADNAGTGTVAWTNPGNITAADGSSATVILGAGASSHYLLGTNLGFAIPTTARLTGISVTVFAAMSAVGPSAVLTAALVRNSQPQLAYTLNNTIINNVFAIRTYGSDTNTWDGTFTAADVNDTNFGVALFATSAGGGTLNIDYVKIQLTYKSVVTISSVAAAGNITLINGRTYFLIARNSKTGHASDLNSPSASTGAITSKKANLTTLAVSADSQIDSRLLLATADGNDQTKLYLVATLDNAATTYDDNMPEATLLTRPVYQNIDANGFDHGVADNTVPPIGASLPVKHRGRLYMVQGQILWFSKNLDDLTTSTGTITGAYEESWPGDNQLDISEGAESGRALLSDGTALYIGTERHVRRLLGSGPADFQPPELLHNEVGVLNQKVWKIIYHEGQPVGAIWLAPDGRVILSDFNSYRNVGTPIQTTLNTLSTNSGARTDLPTGTFVSIQGYDLYVLAIPTGTNLYNDTLCVLNLRTFQWTIWKLTDNVNALLFNIKADGTPQLLVAASTGKLYSINATDLRDRINDTPVQIPVTIQTTWLDLGDATLRKQLNELEITSADVASLLVTIEGASTAQEFNTPVVLGHSLAASKQDPFGVWKVFLAGLPAKYRYYRLTFYSQSAVNEVLDGFNLTGLPLHRV